MEKSYLDQLQSMIDCDSSSDFEPEAEEILDKRIKNGELQYFCRWKNSSEEDSWIYRSELLRASELNEQKV